MEKKLEQVAISMEADFKALEGLKYLNISNESFSEFIVKMIDKLIRALTFLIEDTIDNGLFSSQIENLSQDIENLAVLTRTASLKGNHSTFKVDSRLAALIFRNRPINKIQVITNQLSPLIAVTKAFGEYQDLLAKNNIVGKVTIEDVDKLEEIMDTHNPLIFFSKHPALFTNEGNVLITPHLLNNKRVTVGSGRDNAPIGDPKDIRVSIVNSDPEPRPLPDSIEFERFPTTYQLSTLRKLKELTYMLNVQFGVKQRYNRASTLKDIKRNMTQLSNLVETNPEMDEAKLREVLIYLTTYVKWFTGSYIEIMQLNIRVIKSVINVCTINLNAPK